MLLKSVSGIFRLGKRHPGILATVIAVRRRPETLPYIEPLVSALDLVLHL